MRRPIAMLLSLALLVAACKADSEANPEPTTSEPETTTTAPSQPAASPAPSTTDADVPPATVVFVGGTVLTMDDNAPMAEAVAVDGNRIVAVGSETSVQPYVGPETEVIDLEGKTLMPGLVDAHSHFFANGVNEGVGAGIQETEILVLGHFKLVRAFNEADDMNKPFRLFHDHNG